MYGKHFESMYEGSMYGAGVAVFAVWGYVIAHTRKSLVELNPKKLADTLGGEREEIEKAIRFLMEKDPNSRHKAHEGRRLLKEGEFQYRVPSWEEYRRILNEDERREYNRKKQAEYREWKKGAPLPGETAYERAMREGHDEEAQRLLDGQPMAGGKLRSYRRVAKEIRGGTTKPRSAEEIALDAAVRKFEGKRAAGEERIEKAGEVGAKTSRVGAAQSPEAMEAAKDTGGPDREPVDEGTVPVPGLERSGPAELEPRRLCHVEQDGYCRWDECPLRLAGTGDGVCSLPSAAGGGA
jgi:hypothetical protein